VVTIRLVEEGAVHKPARADAEEKIDLLHQRKRVLVALEHELCDLDQEPRLGAIDDHSGVVVEGGHRSGRDGVDEP